MGKIFYKDRFKGIQWTSDINKEIPIKCNGCPLPNNELNQFIKTFQNEMEKNTQKTQSKGKTRSPLNLTVKSDPNEEPYGSEKPITLCEAFVRKYLTVQKDQVCM